MKFTHRIFPRMAILAAIFLPFFANAESQPEHSEASSHAVGDENWISMGGVDNGWVYALASDGQGNVFVGGWFTEADGLAVNYVAKWNGSNWSAMGTGMNGTVEALAVDAAGNVYAGGGFTMAGGVEANYIARWNGNSWSALGAGMDGHVRALAVDGGGNVYAGGGFFNAGGVSANKIARWNGGTWSSLGVGMDQDNFGFAIVRALTLDASGNLFAAGTFTSAGGAAASNIARWNGSAWSALGSGVNATVWTLAVDASDHVFAGGQFTTAGNVPAAYLAKWDGAEWAPLNSQMNREVNAVLLDGSGNLYAGGFFNTAGGLSDNANAIAKWDGTNWSALGTGITGAVNALAFDGRGHLYAGGQINMAGSLPSKNTAKWRLNPIDDGHVDFAVWAANAGLTEDDALPTATPFNDGVPNLLKFAFNMNLAGPDSSRMEAGGSSGLPSGGMIKGDGQTYFQIEFIRRKNSELTYTPQKSSNLVDESFVPLIGEETVSDIPGLPGFERVTINEPVDPSNENRCFTRVMVGIDGTLPPSGPEFAPDSGDFSAVRVGTFGSFEAGILQGSVTIEETPNVDLAWNGTTVKTSRIQVFANDELDGEQWIARATDGSVYVLRRGEDEYVSPLLWYPASPFVGQSWTNIELGETRELEVISLNATSPGGITGCVLIREISPGDWSEDLFFKDGAFVGNTRTDLIGNDPFEEFYRTGP